MSSISRPLGGFEERKRILDPSEQIVGKTVAKAIGVASLAASVYNIFEGSMVYDVARAALNIIPDLVKDTASSGYQSVKSSANSVFGPEGATYVYGSVGLLVGGIAALQLYRYINRPNGNNGVSTTVLRQESVLTDVGFSQSQSNERSLEIAVRFDGCKGRLNEIVDRQLYVFSAYGPGNIKSLIQNLKMLLTQIEQHQCDERELVRFVAQAEPVLASAEKQITGHNNTVSKHMRLNSEYPK